MLLIILFSSALNKTSSQRHRHGKQVKSWIVHFAITFHIESLYIIYNTYQYISDLPYQQLGCWADSLPRAIESFEGMTPILDGHYKRRKNPILKCYQAAKRYGFKVFAVQDDGQCFTSSTASETFGKYEKSTLCSNGLGGPMANDVYLITNVYWNLPSQLDLKLHQKQLKVFYKMNIEFYFAFI